VLSAVHLTLLCILHIYNQESALKLVRLLTLEKLQHNNANWHALSLSMPMVILADVLPVQLDVLLAILLDVTLVHLIIPI